MVIQNQFLKIFNKRGRHPADFILMCVEIDFIARKYFLELLYTGFNSFKFIIIFCFLIFLISFSIQIDNFLKEFSNILTAFRVFITFYCLIRVLWHFSIGWGEGIVESVGKTLQISLRCLSTSRYFHVISCFLCSSIYFCVLSFTFMYFQVLSGSLMCSHLFFLYYLLLCTFIYFHALPDISMYFHELLCTFN